MNSGSTREQQKMAAAAEQVAAQAAAAPPATEAEMAVVMAAAAATAAAAVAPAVAAGHAAMLDALDAEHAESEVTMLKLWRAHHATSEEATLEALRVEHRAATVAAVQAAGEVTGWLPLSREQTAEIKAMVTTHTAMETKVQQVLRAQHAASETAMLAALRTEHSVSKTAMTVEAMRAQRETTEAEAVAGAEHATALEAMRVVRAQYAQHAVVDGLLTGSVPPVTWLPSPTTAALVAESLGVQEGLFWVKPGMSPSLASATPAEATAEATLAELQVAEASATIKAAVPGLVAEMAAARAPPPRPAAPTRKRTRSATAAATARADESGAAGAAGAAADVAEVVETRKRLRDGAETLQIDDADVTCRAIVTRVGEYIPAWLPDVLREDLRYIRVSDTAPGRTNNTFCKVSLFGYDADQPRLPESYGYTFINEVEVLQHLTHLVDTGVTPSFTRLINFDHWIQKRGTTLAVGIEMEHVRNLAGESAPTAIAYLEALNADAGVDDDTFDRKAKTIAVQVLLALEAAQRHIKLTHRDLFADNVLIGNTAQLADADHARYMRPNGRSVTMPAADVRDTFVTIIDPALAYIKIKGTPMYPKTFRRFMHDGLRCGVVQYDVLDGKLDVKTFFNSLIAKNYTLDLPKGTTFEPTTVAARLNRGLFRNYPTLLTGATTPVRLLFQFNDVIGETHAGKVVVLGDAR